MPKISVIMSVYNSQKFIVKAIESVFKQTYQDFELLLIDDASTDNSFLILKKYAKKFPNKVILLKNRKKIGLTKSLIKLIKHSKGAYIARLDSDDYCHKDRFKTQINWLLKKKDNVLIGSSGYMVDENDKIISKINLDHLLDNKLKKKLIFKNYFLHSSTMFRKSYYYKVGGYNPFFKYTQDYELWSKLSKVGHIKNLKKELIYLRQHRNSVTSKYKTEQALYAFLISCINRNGKNLNFKSKNLISEIKKLKKKTDQTHFDSLCFLYSEYLPAKLSKSLTDLDYSLIKYLLKDKKFFMRKIIKKILIK